MIIRSTQSDGRDINVDVPVVLANLPALLATAETKAAFLADVITPAVEAEKAAIIARDTGRIAAAVLFELGEQLRRA